MKRIIQIVSGMEGYDPDALHVEKAREAMRACITPIANPDAGPSVITHTGAIANAYRVSERAGHFGHADICLSNSNSEFISHSSKLESWLGGLSMFDSTGATRRRCRVLVSLPERRETVTISPEGKRSMARPSGDKPMKRG